MEETKKPQSITSEIASSLSQATNVLVTVNKDPSVDQLAACIGLTLALNKEDKHAAAVFSGEVPSVMEFLEPNKTLEKNTDSLRDFIISIDREKADKLRYKVEDSFVRIFITPYKTSISENDLEFSQGDFNVDAVVALGVQERTQLDEAILAHGRILHDATIISVNNAYNSELGSLNWYNESASSLSEMVAEIIKQIDNKVFDSQIATALLTGIVAETDRFKNDKVTQKTMDMSGILISAGASPNLVATKLEESNDSQEPEDETPPEPVSEPEPTPEPEELPEPEEPKEEVKEIKHTESKTSGVIEIDHSAIQIDDSGKFQKVTDIENERQEIEEQAALDAAEAELKSEQQTEMSSPVESNAGEQASSEINQTSEATTSETPDIVEKDNKPVNSGPSMITEPPTFGSQLTANSEKVDQDYTSNPDPLASNESGATNKVKHIEPIEHSEVSADTTTLSELEKSVNSPHLSDYSPPTEPNNLPTMNVNEVTAPTILPPDSDYARDAVNRAVQSANDFPPKPIASLNAQPLTPDPLHSSPPILPPETQGPPPPPVPPPLPPQ